MKKIFAMILVVVMLMTTLVGCGVKRDNLYDPTNKEITLAEFFFMEESDSVDIPEENMIWDEKEYINSLIDSSNVEICNPDKEYIRGLKEKVIEYFQIEYGIDVTEKINSVETKLIGVSDNVLMGYHKPGSNVVYVNKNLYENLPEYFPFTWCHEVVHMLGIEYDTDMYWGLYETITEAVNLRLVSWMGYPCNNSAYLYAAMIGQQMILANPELVTRSIMDEDFLLEDHINEVLKDAIYPKAKVPAETSIAYQLNAYLICMIQSNELYMQAPEVFHFLIQEIATAYCRSFNLNEEQIEISKAMWLIEDFDETTIKSSGSGIKIKR